jgi:Domain of unknown function (DUF4190)
MTAPGGGEPYRDQPGPWQQYQHPPVDPQAPVNYPEYPPTSQYSGQQPPPSYGPTGYGYPPPPPPYGGPIGYAGQPPYPGPYDPYQGYQAHQTNSLAVASLVTSIAGVVLGIPLALFCFLGWLIPVVGAVLGGVALNQIKRNNQPGRGLAIAGIAIGSATTVLIVLGAIIFAAAMFHQPTFMR